MKIASCVCFALTVCVLTGRIGVEIGVGEGSGTDTTQKEGEAKTSKADGNGSGAGTTKKDGEANKSKDENKHDGESKEQKGKEEASFATKGETVDKKEEKEEGKSSSAEGNHEKSEQTEKASVKVEVKKPDGKEEDKKEDKKGGKEEDKNGDSKASFATDGDGGDSDDMHPMYGPNHDIVMTCTHSVPKYIHMNRIPVFAGGHRPAFEADLISTATVRDVLDSILAQMHPAERQRFHSDYLRVYWTQERHTRFQAVFGASCVTSPHANWPQIPWAKTIPTLGNWFQGGIDQVHITKIELVPAEPIHSPASAFQTLVRPATGGATGGQKYR